MIFGPSGHVDDPKTNYLISFDKINNQKNKKLSIVEVGPEENEIYESKEN